MTRKLAMAGCAAGLAALMALPATALMSSGSGFTLVVAPARYSVLQVCFDLVQREPAVLVSYQGEASTEEPKLHAWNGTEWIRLTVQDFRQASFLERAPSRTILIGDENVLPAVLAQYATWAPETATIKDLTSSALVNEFGRIFKWKTSDWKWFAARYNLQLQDESEAVRTSSWYDQPGPLYRDPTKSIFSRSKQDYAGYAPNTTEYTAEPVEPVEPSPSPDVASEPIELSPPPAMPPAEPDLSTVK